MGKKSGIFQYIDLLCKNKIQGEKLLDVTSWETLCLTSQSQSKFYIMRNPAPDTENNPFLSLNYRLLQDKKYAAHLTFFEEFHSHNSPIAGRKNLSYCHGTEYFSIETGHSTKIMTVHYHFNMMGQYLHATVKEDSASQDAKTIQTTPQQQLVLRERAIQYQTEIKKILAKKSNRYLAFANKVDSEYENIMKNVHNLYKNRDALIKKLNKLSEINNMKDNISDHEANSKATFKMFEKVILNADDYKIDTKEVQPELTDIGLSVVTASQPTALDVKTHKNKKTTAKAIHSNLNNYDQDIKQITEQLQAIEELSRLFNARYSEQDTIKYLNDLQDLQTKYLILSMNAHDNKTTKKLKSLSLRMDNIKTAESIFKDAVANYNLEHIRASFSFCSQTNLYQIYSSLIDEWIFAAQGKKAIETNKIRAIVRYFHENSDLFTCFIKERSQLGIKASEEDHYIYLLGSAYVCNNKEMFLDFLDFGVDLDMPWVVGADGTSYDALFMLKQEEDSFYIDKLIEHGFQFNKVVHAKIVDPSKPYISEMPAPLRKREQKEINNIVQAATKMGRKVGSYDNNTPKDDSEQDRIIHCAFIFLTNIITDALQEGNKIYNQSLGAYANYAKYCPLSSLLFSAALLYSNSNIYLSSVVSSKNFGLDCITGSRNHFLCDVNNQNDGTSRYIYNVFDDENVSSNTVKACLSIIAKEIKTRFPDGVTEFDFKNAWIKLKYYEYKFQIAGAHDIKVYTYMAMIFLVGLKSKLILSDYELVMGCWRDAGIENINQYTNINKVYTERVKSKKLQIEEHIWFKSQRSNNLIEALANFYHAQKTAYHSPFKELLSNPIMLYCVDESAKIINNKILLTQTDQKQLDYYAQQLEKLQSPNNNRMYSSARVGS